MVTLGVTPTPAEQGIAVERGRLVEGIACLNDPAQTYTLYLPVAYTPERSWPVLLVLDPRGRSLLAAERFAEAAEERGWVILSSDGTWSDGPMEPNLRALQALWSEVHIRFATDPRRLYAAGFSGLGNVACELGRETGGVAGVIVSGSRWTEERSRRPIRVPTFGTVGDVDFNFTPMREFHSRLGDWGTPERLEVFAGGHSWMPPELARLAIEWMELRAIKQGLRPEDGALVERVLVRDRRRAAELEASGRLLDAQRLYERAAATLEGLAPVEELLRAAERLAKDPATRRARESEERWARFEQVTLQRQGDSYRTLASSDPPVILAKLRAGLQLDVLQRQSAATGDEGVVARRLLNTVATQTGFYLPRDFMERGEPDRAALSLDIATELRPRVPDLWYDLARARARTGASQAALDALEKAVSLGFSDRDQMASDPDLDPLRAEPRYQALLAGGWSELTSSGERRGVSP